MIDTAPETILRALTAARFDPVPLGQMGKTERAATTEIPAAITARFDPADKLSDEDRQAIFELAENALIPFPPT